MRAFQRGRIPLGPTGPLRRGNPLKMFIDDVATTAYEGESVAAVIIATDGLQTRTTANGSPRGYYCGMGVCFDCLVVVDGVPNTRACMTLATEGMRVRRQLGPGKGS